MPMTEGKLGKFFQRKHATVRGGGVAYSPGASARVAPP